ncbi:hypothetical protein QBC34DRAFT_363491, partial [Podospora aff. communis PSN243]
MNSIQLHGMLERSTQAPAADGALKQPDFRHCPEEESGATDHQAPYRGSFDDEGDSTSLLSDTTSDDGDLEELLPLPERNKFVDYMLGQLGAHLTKNPSPGGDAARQIGGSLPSGTRASGFAPTGAAIGLAKRGNVLTPSNNGGDDDEEEDQPHRRHPQEDNEDDECFLACPFYKWNPEAHPKCGNKVLRTISRLKHHIWRAHDMGIHCYSCFEQFRNEQDVATHMRARACQTRRDPPRDAITSEQRARIKKRVDPRKSKSQLWFDIFRVLFPEDPVPASPYVDSMMSPSTNMAGVRNYISNHWRSVFNAQAQQRLPPNLLWHSQAVEAIYHDVFEATISILLDRLERPHSDRSPGGSLGTESNIASSEYDTAIGSHGCLVPHITTGSGPSWETGLPLPVASHLPVQGIPLADFSVQTFLEPSASEDFMMGFDDDQNMYDDILRGDPAG